MLLIFKIIFLILAQIQFLCSWLFSSDYDYSGGSESDDGMITEIIGPLQTKPFVCLQRWIPPNHRHSRGSQLLAEVSSSKVPLQDVVISFFSPPARPSLFAGSLTSRQQGKEKRGFLGRN